MQHTAMVGSAKDCEDLVLLMANATPTENRYQFRVNMESRVECYAGKYHFGAVKVKRLFSYLVKIGKRKSKERKSQDGGIEITIS